MAEVILGEDDLRQLRECAWARALSMFPNDDRRQRMYAAQFEHQEYLKMVTPPYRSDVQRLEDRLAPLLVEIRDLLKSK